MKHDIFLPVWFLYSEDCYYYSKGKYKINGFFASGQGIYIPGGCHYKALRGHPTHHALHPSYCIQNAESQKKDHCILFMQWSFVL